MGLEREHRLDQELTRLLDELARPEQVIDVPGKRTRVQQLVERLAGPQRIELLAAVPGRRTLVERVLAMAGVLAFEDFRVLALREVLHAIGPRPALQRATVGAADREVARRAVPQARPAKPDAGGHAMWRAAERRAATLYRHAAEAGEVEPDDPSVEAALARAGSGAPLPAAVRRKMEDELGVALDRVRVHTDPVAARAARAIRAEAFTVGEDIFFAEHAYAPDSRAGQKLIAHELAHVVQGWHGRSDGAQRVSQPGDPLEREADAVAARVEGGAQRAEPGARPGERDGARGGERGGKRPDAPRTAPGASATLQRKAAGPAAQRPSAPGTAGTIMPTIQPTVRRRASGQQAPVDNQAEMNRQLGHQKQAIHAAFAPLKKGAADAKKKKIGDQTAAKTKQEAHEADAHQKHAHDEATKHKAAAEAHKHAKHDDDDTGVPPPPKLDPSSPIQFKKITDWSKYLPPAMPDQDEREKKHLLALIKNKIIGEQVAAQKILGALHAAQLKQADALRAMKPTLQGQIAAAQQRALGQVAASEASQAAAVAAAFSAAKGRVSGAAAAAKGTVNAAYSAAVAGINAANQTANTKLTTGQNTSNTAITAAEGAQIVVVQAQYTAIRATVASNASAEASHAAGLADSVSLPYSGDKLDAAKKAAHGVADGWSKDIPGKMQDDAQTNIYSHQGESEQGVHDFAKQQLDQVKTLYTDLKQALDAAHTQALAGAASAKSGALAQIDAMTASTLASLSAQSAAQVASVHKAAAGARAGIIKAGQAAQAAVAAACDSAAGDLVKGAAGLVEGAKQVEAPDPAYTEKAVEGADKQLKTSATSTVAGLKQQASSSAADLTKQAGDAAKSMAAIAVSARTSANQAAQSAAQSLAKSAQSAATSLHKMQEGFEKQATKIGDTADSKFPELVQQTRDVFKSSTDKLQSGLKGAADNLKANYASCIDDKETAQILEEAKKAADAVKPWWQRALAFVLTVVVVIVIMVAVTVLTAGLGTGPMAIVIGVAVGAAAGAVTSIASQVVDNLVMGEPAFNINWKEVGISALAGAITGGIAAGAGEYGGAAVSAAMQGAKGIAPTLIRFGVNAGAGMIGDVGAHLAIDHHYNLDMKNLAMNLGFSAVMSHSSVVGAQNKLGDSIRGKFGRDPIHGEGGEGGGGSGGGEGGHTEPGNELGGAHANQGDNGLGNELGNHPTGNNHPTTGNDHPTGNTGNTGNTGDSGGSGGGKHAAPDDSGGGKHAAPDDTGGGKHAAPDDSGGGKHAAPDDSGGGKHAAPDDNGGGKHAAPDDNGGGKHAAPDDNGGGKHAAPDDNGGGKHAAPDDQPNRSPEQEAHDEARDSELEKDGYVQGTREKADKAASEIEQGQTPKKENLRDTEANAKGREDLDKLLKDPRLTPEERAAIQKEIADRVRGEADPTGNLDRDVRAGAQKAAKDLDAARAAQAKASGAKPKDIDSGLTQAKIDEILGTPKGQRPDPKDYLPPEYVKAQLAKFQDGAARFMTEENLAKYGIGQRDGTSFVMPKGEADALLASAHGDPGKLEEALGLPKGFLESNSLVRVDIPKPDEFGLRIPSGNESGANDQWLPSGKLPTGNNEGIIDAKGMTSGKDYNTTPVKMDAKPHVDPTTPPPPKTTAKDPPTSGKDPPTGGSGGGKDHDPPTGSGGSGGGKDHDPPTGSGGTGGGKDHDPPTGSGGTGGGKDKDPPSGGGGGKDKDPPTGGGKDKDPSGPNPKPPKTFDELQDHLSAKAKAAIDQQRQIRSEANMDKMAQIGRKPDGTYDVDKANAAWESKHLDDAKFQNELNKHVTRETGKAQEQVDRVNNTANENDGTKRPGATVGDGTTEAALKQEAETGEPVGGVEGHANKTQNALDTFKDAVVRLEAAKATVKDPKVRADIDAAIARANDRIAKMQPAMDLWNNRVKLYPGIWNPDGTPKIPPGGGRSKPKPASPPI